MVPSGRLQFQSMPVRNCYKSVTRAPVSARAIALIYLELHVRYTICVSEIQSFIFWIKIDKAVL